MEKIFARCFFILLFWGLIANSCVAQNANGSFRSKQSGLWSLASCWQIKTSNGWIDSSIIPSTGAILSIQNGHTITLDFSTTVGDLHLNTSATIACTANTLSCNGKIRAYTGSAETSSIDASYTNSNSPTNNMITCTSGGRLKFIGSSRVITNTGEWGASGLTSSALIEFALDANQTGTFNTGFKANTILISSGIINMGTNRLAPDNGSAGQGDCTIGSDAVLLSNASSVSAPVMSRTTNAVTGRSGTFTLNGTLKLSGNNPYIEFSNLVFNAGATVEYNGAAQSWLNSSYTSAAKIASYQNVILSGTNATKTTIASQTTTVNEKLSIQGSATLVLGNSATLQYGTNSTLEYKGASSQSTGSNPPEWPSSNGPYNLIINNSGGLILGTSREISGQLTLTSGIITTTDSTLLTLGVTASVSGASNNSFVDGPLKKTGNVPFVFPVGKLGTGLQPLEISAPSQVSDALTVEYVRSSPYNLGYLTSGGIAKVSGCEYWQLVPSSGSSTIDVTLHGNTNSGCSPASGTDYFTGNGSSITNLRVCRFNNATSTWGDLGGTSTGTSPDITTKAIGVGSFGIFTFGTLVGNPLPVKLISFGAQNCSAGVMLHWSTASEINSDFFEIERSFNGVNFKSIKRIPASGSSTAKINYQCIDSLNAEEPVVSSKMYYRLAIKDKDNKSLFSNIRMIDKNDAKINPRINVYPLPFENSFKLNLASNRSEKAELKVYGCDGTALYKQEINLSKGENTIDCSELALLPAGVYLLTISNDYFRKTIQITKSR